MPPRRSGSSRRSTSAAQPAQAKKGAVSDKKKAATDSGSVSTKSPPTEPAMADENEQRSPALAAPVHQAAPRVCPSKKQGFRTLHLLFLGSAALLSASAYEYFYKDHLNEYSVGSGIAMFVAWVIAYIAARIMEQAPLTAMRMEIRKQEQEFIKAYPEMRKTAHIGALRKTEFARLDAERHVYLDYTGGGIYAECQLQQHMALLSKNTFGNPHSSNPTSMAMTQLVEKTRHDILRFFNTDMHEYDCIFTSNASGALRIVGESYPFRKGGWYMLPADNHNSVNGIREFAKNKGAGVKYLHVGHKDLRMRLDEVTSSLNTVGAGSDAPKLFAFPGQSNFSGVKHPLELIGRAQQAGWDVMLDAAALAPTSRIDLSIIKPDFMCISFYKIFGYPTGMGALLVKRSSLPKLCARPWFAGGTIEVALVSSEKHWLHQDHEAFEDGTINYLNIPALSIGLDVMNEMGMENVNTRVRCMTSYLLDRFKAMKHKNGRRLVTFYGPEEVENRGGTIALNAFDPEGQWDTCWEVEQLANQRNISLRAGCFCNPGDSEAAFQWEDVVAKAESITHMTKGNFSARVPVAGAVRVSVGIATNFADLWACCKLFESLLDRPHADVAAEVARICGGPVGPQADV